MWASVTAYFLGVFPFLFILVVQFVDGGLFWFLSAFWLLCRRDEFLPLSSLTCPLAIKSSLFFFDKEGKRVNALEIDMQSKSC